MDGVGEEWGVEGRRRIRVGEGKDGGGKGWRREGREGLCSSKNYF